MRKTTPKQKKDRADAGGFFDFGEFEMTEMDEMKRTREAFDLLLPAADMFSKAWPVPYNLACYCAQLGRLKEARQWLEKAFETGDSKEVKLMALDDPDLEPIWANIAEI